MLVLERKLGERIFIGDTIVITVVDIREMGTKVRIGIEAPSSLVVDREEIAGRRSATGKQRQEGRRGNDPKAID